MQKGILEAMGIEWCNRAAGRIVDRSPQCRQGVLEEASETYTGTGFFLGKGLFEEGPIDYIAGGDGIPVAWS